MGVEQSPCFPLTYIYPSLICGWTLSSSIKSSSVHCTRMKMSLGRNSFMLIMIGVIDLWSILISTLTTTSEVCSSPILNLLLVNFNSSAGELCVVRIDSGSGWFLGVGSVVPEILEELTKLMMLLFDGWAGLLQRYHGLLSRDGPL